MFGGNSNWRGPIWIAIELYDHSIFCASTYVYGLPYQYGISNGSGIKAKTKGNSQLNLQEVVKLFEP